MISIKADSWIVHTDSNPTTDFFVKPYFKDRGKHCCYFDLLELPESLPKQQIDLIVVRYLNSKWFNWINKNRKLIRRLIFFMDDDLFDFRVHGGLPLNYRFKLFRRAYRYQGWLKKQNAELWVSTEWLQRKYAIWNPRVISPNNPHRKHVTQKTVFYHGSASHVEEFLWLKPVIKEVLEQDPTITFEVIGDQKIRQLYRSLPRVNVLHPMGWRSYQALLARPGRAIGLAPLSDASFNQARSPTKFYDIQAAGAVGVYADHPVYQSVIKHEDNGLLIPMQQKLWVEAILRLSRDSDMREKLTQGMEP